MPSAVNSLSLLHQHTTHLLTVVTQYSPSPVQLLALFAACVQYKVMSVRGHGWSPPGGSSLPTPANPGLLVDLAGGAGGRARKHMNGPMLAIEGVSTLSHASGEPT
jgi:hypothetical protein